MDKTPRRLIFETQPTTQGQFVIIEPDATGEGTIKTPIGRLVSATVVSHVPKAVVGDETSYDVDSEFFQKAMRQKTSPDIPVMWGPELTLRVNGEELLFFAGTNSARPFGFTLSVTEGETVLMTTVSTTSGNGKWSWYAPRRFKDIQEQSIQRRIDRAVASAERTLNEWYEAEYEVQRPTEEPHDGTCGEPNCELCV